MIHIPYHPSWLLTNIWLPICCWPNVRTFCLTSNTSDFWHLIYSLTIANCSKMYVMCSVGRTFWKKTMHCTSFDSSQYIYPIFFYLEKFKLLNVLELIYYALRCCSKLICYIKSFAIKYSSNFFFLALLAPKRTSAHSKRDMPCVRMVVQVRALKNLNQLQDFLHDSISLSCLKID